MFKLSIFASVTVFLFSIVNQFFSTSNLRRKFELLLFFILFLRVGNFSKLVMFRFLFNLCVQFLSFIGHCFRFNYEEISVLINLYFQGIILTISGFLPLVASSYALVIEPGSISLVIWIMMLSYASFYGVECYFLFRHYPLKLENSFRQCVLDLLSLCDCLHFPYIMLNLLIFVVWWLAVIFVNCLLSYYILP